jgi:hypothetical protein
MSTPLALPDWVPWWAQLLALIVAIMLTLCFVLMPFSVFGLKPRLEAIEARLDEIQGEIRALSLRLPEPAPRPSLVSEPPLQAAPAAARPPIPPAAWSPGAAPRRPIGSPAAVRAEPEVYRPAGRVEPRIDRGR